MLDHLRQVIGLRGYGQRDPLNEYKAESFSLFEAMSQSLREAVTAQLMRVEIQAAPPRAAAGAAAGHGGAQARSDDRRGRNGAGGGRRRNAGAPWHRRDAGGPAIGAALAGAAPARAAERLLRGVPARNPQDPQSWGKVGRNEACPCGSGKKFKHCHGRYV